MQKSGCHVVPGNELENEMRFKAPENCDEANVGGEHFRVDEDGCIETPDTGDYINLLKPHGFVPVEAKPKEEKKQVQQTQQQFKGNKK